MGKKSKKQKAKQQRRGGGPANNTITPTTTLFAVPPRSTAAILGPIGPNARATKRVVAELLHAVQYEKQSATHLDVMERVVAAAAAVLDQDTAAPSSVPQTYETPGMIRFGPSSRLIFGCNARFSLLTLELEACDNAVVLSDEGMGEEDSKTSFAGGEGLGLQFHAPGVKSLCVFLGECQLIEKDLWDFAVQFRDGSGQFTWPGYFSVLQCPFCANLAVPEGDSNNNNNYMMISQTIKQHTDQDSLAARDIPRLCCKECFFRNLVRSSNNQTDDELAAMLSRKSVPALHHGGAPSSSPSSSSRALKPSESAYSLSSLYERSGIRDVFGRKMATSMTQAMAQRSAEQNTNRYKSRVSKSKTEKNRGQPVVIIKSVEDRPMCAACGISSTSLKTCSRCNEAGFKVYFCGAACQKSIWKQHKKICGKGIQPSAAMDGSTGGDASSSQIIIPQPSTELGEGIQRSNKNTARQQQQRNKGTAGTCNDDDNDEPMPLCNWCQSNPVDEGCPAMCICCGTFLVCGPCSCKPDMSSSSSTTLQSGGGSGQEQPPSCAGLMTNGRPPVPFFVCNTCSSEPRRQRDLEETPPGLLLRRLLDRRPVGRHVRYTRLILAQCMLSDYQEYTGIRQDVEAARREYLWLANDQDYPLAQFAMATFHDPSTHVTGEIWDGPCCMGDDVLEEYGLATSPFPPDQTKSMEYYNRAVEGELTMALTTVGTMYKNGDMYPVNKQKAARMLEQAVARGDAKAMCNLGQMKVRADGITQDFEGGIALYQQAAKLGLFNAMFMIAQFGMQNPSLRPAGRQMVETLVAEDWEPPNAQHDEIWYMLRRAYGL